MTSTCFIDKEKWDNILQLSLKNSEKKPLLKLLENDNNPTKVKILWNGFSMSTAYTAFIEINKKLKNLNLKMESLDRGNWPEQRIFLIKI